MRQYLSICSAVSQQGPAARYLKNVELKEEVGQASRTVEKQEREIEALKCQLDETDEPGRFIKAKVGDALIYMELYVIRVFLYVYVLCMLAPPNSLLFHYS